MAESPLQQLRRWEEHGASWRLIELSDERAVVQLTTCHGEPVERLESDDAELIGYLRQSTGPATIT